MTGAGWWFRWFGRGLAGVSIFVLAVRAFELGIKPLLQQLLIPYFAVIALLEPLKPVLRDFLAQFQLALPEYWQHILVIWSVSIGSALRAGLILKSVFSEGDETNANFDRSIAPILLGFLVLVGVYVLYADKTFLSGEVRAVFDWGVFPLMYLTAALLVIGVLLGFALNDQIKEGWFVVPLLTLIVPSTICWEMLCAVLAALALFAINAGV